MPRVKYWEIIADNLSKAGWSWGYVSALDCEGRTIWIADVHRGDEKRFAVRGMKSRLRLWNLKRRFALAANCLDKVVRFLPDSPNTKTPILQVLIHHAMARAYPNLRGESEGE